MSATCLDPAHRDLDAAWLETAREAGLTLVSGNISGMDVLLQAGDEVSVLLYGTDRETAPD